VATQGLTKGRGVLVLSEFAGAAAELRGAVLTNPHDPREMAETCYRALALPRSETRQRMQDVFDTVSRYDIRHWGDEFLEAVAQWRQAHRQRTGRKGVRSVA